MVKKFYKTSVDSIILQTITILGLLLTIYYCIISIKHLILNDINENYTVIIFETIIFCLGIPMLSYIELTFLFGNIVLDSQAISTKGDIKFGKEKIQYPLSINYSEITEIVIMALRKNSKGNHISLSRPIPYLVLSNKKGKKYRFGLHFMSKKTVRSLLIELKDKCTNNNEVQFDVDKLMKDFSLAKLSVKEK